MRRTFNTSSAASLLETTSAKARRGPPSFRPMPKRLEDRKLLATVTWINPGGGDWDTPSNWSTGRTARPLG